MSYSDKNSVILQSITTVEYGSPARLKTVRWLCITA